MYRSSLPSAPRNTFIVQRTRRELAVQFRLKRQELERKASRENQAEEQPVSQQTPRALFIDLRTGKIALRLDEQELLIRLRQTTN
jgi:hypothetical protein